MVNQVTQIVEKEKGEVVTLRLLMILSKYFGNNIFHSPKVISLNP